MEPRYPKSDPSPKLAMAVARIDIVLKERCSHLLKRFNLENPKRVITRKTSERETRKKRRMSTMRSLRNRAFLLNDFGGSRTLSMLMSEEVCNVSECFDMVCRWDIV